MKALADILKLTRRLVVVDAETTGTDTEKDRIVQLGALSIEPDGTTREWRTLVNPGRPIPAEATAVHDIMDVNMLLCNECGKAREEHPLERCLTFRPVPPFYKLAPKLAVAMVNCDFAGKNVRFDLRILSTEFKLAKVQWSYADAAIIDAERIEQLGEPRTLSDLYRRRVGKEPVSAHDALADVKMSAELLIAQLALWPALAEGGVSALHERQWPGWIDSEGKFRMVNGVPCLGGWGKFAYKTMAEVTRLDKSYWDWILKAAFPEDVKVIAARAKLGEYPE